MEQVEGPRTRGDTVGREGMCNVSSGGRGGQSRITAHTSMIPSYRQTVLCWEAWPGPSPGDIQGCCWHCHGL